MSRVRLDSTTLVETGDGLGSSVQGGQASVVLSDFFLKIEIEIFALKLSREHSKMVNLDGTKAVSKSAKGTHDRLKALEIAIYDLRSSENDKNWQNVEKCLQVRNLD